MGVRNKYTQAKPVSILQNTGKKAKYPSDRHPVTEVKMAGQAKETPAGKFDRQQGIPGVKLPL